MIESSESETDNGEEVEVDVEDDLEQITVISLFDDAQFDNVAAMLAYVKTSFNFDLASVQQKLGENSSDLPVHLITGNPMVLLIGRLRGVYDKLRLYVRLLGLRIKPSLLRPLLMRSFRFGLFGHGQVGQLRASPSTRRPRAIS